MAIPAWLDKPIVFRPTVPAGFDPVTEGQGLLRASGLPQAAAVAVPWMLRATSLFDPRFPGLVADYFADPKPFVEMRLCAGPASEAEWDALAILAERLRAVAAEGVLRLEHWYAGSTPIAPEPEIVKRLRGLRPLFIHAWVENEAHLTPTVQAT
jgi:hypothetical protein